MTKLEHEHRHRVEEWVFDWLGKSHNRKSWKSAWREGQIEDAVSMIMECPMGKAEVPATDSPQAGSLTHKEQSVILVGLARLSGGGGGGDWSVLAGKLYEKLSKRWA